MSTHYYKTAILPFKISFFIYKKFIFISICIIFSHPFNRQMAFQCPKDHIWVNTLWLEFTHFSISYNHKWHCSWHFDDKCTRVKLALAMWPIVYYKTDWCPVPCRKLVLRAYCLPVHTILLLSTSPFNIVRLFPIFDTKI